MNRVRMLAVVATPILLGAAALIRAWLGVQPAVVEVDVPPPVAAAGEMNDIDRALAESMKQDVLQKSHLLRDLKTEPPR